MKRNYKKSCIYILGLVINLTSSSCRKMFDIEPEDALSQEQMYRNVYDADAVVLGVYGKFMNLSKSYIILNELRADLLDITPNADNSLREINTNNVTLGNKYVDPRPYYEVILNCNDALENFKKMRTSFLLTEEEYYQRTTDLLLIRAWTYLQLGIQYGEVPYVTDPLEDMNALKDASKFARISFDSLIDKLIESVKDIPAKYLNQNTSSSSPTLIMPNSGYIIKDGVFKFFIHRRAIIGDLYLWKGDYLTAATYYKTVMETGSNQSTTPDYQIELYDTYRITNDRSGRNTLMVDGTTNPWPNIFSNILSETEVNRERMWTLPFDANFTPKNPLIDIFSSSGAYLLKPSQLIINDWDKQERVNKGGLTDRRGLGASYSLLSGQPEVAKYLRNYSPTTPFNTTGVWILYRAATLHLRYAEAVNRLGYDKLASVLINDGILAGYGGLTSGLPAPFNFDGTNTATVRGAWYRSIGIRGRALNKNVAVDSTRSFDMTQNPRVLTNQQQLTLDTEDLIFNEAALETAFEGYRWPDLLRIGLRREKEISGSGLKFINDHIARKFAAGASGNPKVFTSVESLYLPFNWAE